ncbi:MAG TPA: energy transducer TonB [Polyangiaceae bacterium]
MSGYGLSLLVHFGFAAGLAAIPKETRRRPTAVTVFEAKLKKEKPKEEKKEDKPPEPPKPVVVPKQLLVRAAEPPPPAQAPPPPAAAAPGHEAMAALPDFGISLGGSVGGIGVPSGGGGSGARREPERASIEKRARPAAPAATAPGEAPCEEPPTKPAYRERVMPQYTDDARAAGVEGRVRVEVTLNTDGDVVAARVVEGLGHGLDESATVALKRAKFRPITRCGKPVAAPTPFVIPLRFSLSD